MTGLAASRSRRPLRPLAPTLRTILLGRAPERYRVQLGGRDIGTVEKGRTDRYGRSQWIARGADGEIRVCPTKDQALIHLKIAAAAPAEGGAS